MIFHLSFEYWQTCYHSEGRHKFKGKDTSRLQGPTKNSRRSSTQFAQVELVIQCLASEKDLWTFTPRQSWESKQGSSRHPIELAQAYEMSFLLAQPWKGAAHFRVCPGGGEEGEPLPLPPLGCIAIASQTTLGSRRRALGATSGQWQLCLRSF